MPYCYFFTYILFFINALTCPPYWCIHDNNNKHLTTKLFAFSTKCWYDYPNSLSRDLVVLTRFSWYVFSYEKLLYRRGLLGQFNGEPFTGLWDLLCYIMQDLLTWQWLKSPIQKPQRWGDDQYTCCFDAKHNFRYYTWRQQLTKLTVNKILSVSTSKASRWQLLLLISDTNFELRNQINNLMLSSFYTYICVHSGVGWKYLSRYFVSNANVCAITTWWQDLSSSNSWCKRGQEGSIVYYVITTQNRYHSRQLNSARCIRGSSVHWCG